jgi:hypothetical protein
VFHLIFKQDFGNFRQMESAQQASHYLQGLSRCSVPFYHWTFRNRKTGFFVQMESALFHKQQRFLTFKHPI